MKLDRKNLLVYAVTDRSWLNGRNLQEDVEKAILGGATMIQLREKDISHSEFVLLAFDIKKICKRYSVPFIINDNVDVMLEVDADGIHVGQDDMIASEVRRKIGDNKILGVSAQTVEEALLAEKMGADYLGVGTVFSTSTKLDAIDVSLNELTKICNSVLIPVVAIGGINKGNICKLKSTMIDGVAVVSAIFAQDNISEATMMIEQEVKKIIFDESKFINFIVDCDGTILDSVPMWEHMFSNYAKSKGFDPKENLDEIGKTQTNYEAACYFQKNYLPDVTVEYVLKDMDQFTAKLYSNQNLKIGALEFLQRINKYGRVYLFSATSKYLLELLIAEKGLTNLFDGIYSASDLNVTKTDGSGYEKVIELVGANPKTTIIIEDASHAINGAYQKKLNILGISDYSNKDEMEEIRQKTNFFINLEKERIYE